MLEQTKEVEEGKAKMRWELSDLANHKAFVMAPFWIVLPQVLSDIHTSRDILTKELTYMISSTTYVLTSDKYAVRTICCMCLGDLQSRTTEDSLESASNVARLR